MGGRLRFIVELNTATTELPPQSLRDSSPRGGASTALDPPPLGEVAQRAGGGYAATDVLAPARAATGSTFPAALARFSPFAISFFRSAQ